MNYCIFTHDDTFRSIFIYYHKRKTACSSSWCLDCLLKTKEQEKKLLIVDKVNLFHIVLRRMHNKNRGREEPGCSTDYSFKHSSS